MDQLKVIGGEVVACRRCPRLVQWREASAADPPRRYAGQTYHAAGVPGFGDPAAAIMLVGLAPAAHGANRTGRMFTGDRSGDFLFAALHRTGLANQATSTAIDDGLTLRGVWVTAMVRCAPPANTPTADEKAACETFLERELEAISPKVIVALGGSAWTATLKTMRDRDPQVRRPKFAHGAMAVLEGITVLAAYHPSQQNTFTGRLTPVMLDEVLSGAKAAADLP